MRNLRVDDSHLGPCERRGEARHPAVENASQLAWWEDDRSVSTAAQLMDVSRDGLLVIADDEPPAGVPVRVRLLKPTVTDWAEADLVESLATRHGPFQLRLTFSTPPAAVFLDAATARCVGEN